VTVITAKCHGAFPLISAGWWFFPLAIIFGAAAQPFGPQSGHRRKVLFFQALCDK
jgi:hypothetical protein